MSLTLVSSENKSELNKSVFESKRCNLDSHTLWLGPSWRHIVSTSPRAPRDPLKWIQTRVQLNSEVMSSSPVKGCPSLSLIKRLARTPSCVLGAGRVTRGPTVNAHKRTQNYVIRQKRPFLRELRLFVKYAHVAFMRRQIACFISVCWTETSAGKMDSLA